MCQTASTQPRVARLSRRLLGAVMLSKVRWIAEDMNLARQRLCWHIMKAGTKASWRWAWARRVFWKSQGTNFFDSKPARPPSTRDGRTASSADSNGKVITPMDTSKPRQYPQVTKPFYPRITNGMDSLMTTICVIARFQVASLQIQRWYCKSHEPYRKSFNFNRTRLIHSRISVRFGFWVSTTWWLRLVQSLVMHEHEHDWMRPWQQQIPPMSQRRAIRGQSASILQEYGTSALRNSWARRLGEHRRFQQS